MIITMDLKVYGQEMVDVNNKVSKGTTEVTEMLELKLKGMKGDSKTKFKLRVDPKFKDEYPIGAIATLKLVVEQGSLDLKGSAAAKGATKAGPSRVPSTAN